MQQGELSKQLNIPGYRVAAKTGTAQQPDGRGGYLPSYYVVCYGRRSGRRSAICRFGQHRVPDYDYFVGSSGATVQNDHEPGAEDVPGQAVDDSSRELRPVLLKVSPVTGSAPSTLRPEHPVARPLAQLVAEFGLECRGDLDAVEVTGVALSSAAVEPGDLYVGVPGRTRTVHASPPPPPKPAPSPCSPTRRARPSPPTPACRSSSRRMRAPRWAPSPRGSTAPTRTRRPCSVSPARTARRASSTC